jgi:hypothetical protein
MVIDRRRRSTSRPPRYRRKIAAHATRPMTKQIKARISGNRPANRRHQILRVLFMHREYRPRLLKGCEGFANSRLSDFC